MRLIWFEAGNERGWMDTSLKAPHTVSLPPHHRVSHASITGLTISCLGTANSSSLNPILY